MWYGFLSYFMVQFSYISSFTMKKNILTNEERKYLGLTPIESHWERMDIKNVVLFFDNNTINKLNFLN